MNTFPATCRPEAQRRLHPKLTPRHSRRGGEPHLGPRGLAIVNAFSHRWGSLSDSPFQDPTTAMQALDRLHDCLRQLACRQLSDGRYYDEEGELRLVVPAMDWDDYVQLAFDEIRLAGAASPQVTRRLVAALHDLKSITPTDRHAALDRQLELLSVLAEERIFDERDVTMALHGDRLGIGVHRE